jgi:hypothetical protein
MATSLTLSQANLLIAEYPDLFFKVMHHKHLGVWITYNSHKSSEVRSVLVSKYSERKPQTKSSPEKENVCFSSHSNTVTVRFTINGN